MRLIKLGVCSLVVLGFFIAFLQVTTAKADAPPAPAKEVAPSGKSDRLEQDFHKAKKFIEEKAYKNAANEIRNAAGILKQESGNATGEVQKSLLGARDDLEALSKRVENGTVKSAEDVQGAFGRAHEALAEYYSTLASESWSKKATAQVGDYLKQSADHLEKAWIWSGRQIDAGTQAAIDSARKVGQQLGQGAGWVATEVTKSIDGVEKEVARFSKGGREASWKPLVLMPVESPETMVPRPDLTTNITRVARLTMPAVVQVRVTERREVPNPFFPFEGNPFFRHFFNMPKKMPKKFKEELKGLGTGMIVDKEGHILTNNHVVGGASEIQVLLSNGDEYPAKVVGTDPKTDLGVIKISVGKPLPFVTFGDSDQVRVGQWVIAIGHPRGLDQTVTQGIISAKHRAGITDPSSYQDFLQTDAAINPGNSGGPLLTLGGKVIGVNSAIATESGGFEGIGFSIPSKMAVHVANALIAHGKVQRGWLGVSIQDLTPALAKSFDLPAPKGALIADVMKNGPADKAGFKRGDIVMQYDGKDVSDSAMLRNMVASTTIGREVNVAVWRDKQKIDLKVKVGNLEELTQKLSAEMKNRLGVVVAPVTAEQASQYGLSAPEGVAIQWVDPKGPLGKVGFEVGDIILAVDKSPISGVDDFDRLIGGLPHHQKIVLLALDHRSGNTSYVQVIVN
jgi:serine protease Do